jgi:hypothetical protein
MGMKKDFEEYWKDQKSKKLLTLDVVIFVLAIINLTSALISQNFTSILNAVVAGGIFAALWEKIFGIGKRYRQMKQIAENALEVLRRDTVILENQRRQARGDNQLFDNW